MCKQIVVITMILAWLGVASTAVAQESAGQKDAKHDGELEKLKARVEAIESELHDHAVEELVDKLGNKLKPIRSLYGLKMGAGITIVAQGIDYNGSKGAGSVSADVLMESPIGKHGMAVIIFDIQRGAGIQNIPVFFTAPNENATGPNNDIESFNNDQIHIAQLYYEHNFINSLVVSVGQLDPTVYFDTNVLSNNERTDFLANEFANNPTIEFGGTDNFYGPGVRVAYAPAKYVNITAGAFEGNGDYIDMFHNPFFITEVDFKFEPFGKEGNYRVYYWNRQGRTSVTSTANPNDVNLLKAENKGVGVSIDQVVTDFAGVWLRAGIQREKVAQFDSYIGGGINIRGDSFNRPKDVIGLGYGAAFIGKDYKDFKMTSSPNFESGVEHYIELYYNMAIEDAQQFHGFHISPDIQYVINPGGDGKAAKLFIYGIRLQTFF